MYQACWLDKESSHCFRHWKINLLFIPKMPIILPAFKKLLQPPLRKNPTSPNQTRNTPCRPRAPREPRDINLITIIIIIADEPTRIANIRQHSQTKQSPRTASNAFSKFTFEIIAAAEAEFIVSAHAHLIENDLLEIVRFVVGDCCAADSGDVGYGG